MNLIPTKLRWIIWYGLKRSRNYKACWCHDFNPFFIDHFQIYIKQSEKEYLRILWISLYENICANISFYKNKTFHKHRQAFNHLIHLWLIIWQSLWAKSHINILSFILYWVKIRKLDSKLNDMISKKILDISYFFDHYSFNDFTHKMSEFFHRRLK